MKCSTAPAHTTRCTSPCRFRSGARATRRRRQLQAGSGDGGRNGAVGDAGRLSSRTFPFKIVRSLLLQNRWSLSSNSVRPELVEGLSFFLNQGMVFWTYMLHCDDRSFYVGHSDDLQNRIAAHETGTASRHTAARLPIKLVWSQEFGTREEALEAERKLKGWSRSKKLELIREDWTLISALPRGESREVEPFDKLRA